MSTFNLDRSAVAPRLLLARLETAQTLAQRYTGSWNFLVMSSRCVHCSFFKPVSPTQKNVVIAKKRCARFDDEVERKFYSSGRQ